MGEGSPSTKDGPASATASTMMARTVVTTMPMKMPPRTCRATRIPHNRSPKANTAVGHEAIDPSIPSPTGTVVPAASGSRRTKPESTKPTMAMNSPMPTAIAALRSEGMASKTALRNPLTARMTMMMPSMTISPMASAHVTCLAMVTATRELMPRPVAKANG